MSDIHFREPNQVKWQGSRPGHNGTQVLVSLQSAVTPLDLMYTVPAGQTLFLTYAAGFPNVNAANLIKLQIYTDGAVLWYQIAGAYSFAAQAMTGFTCTFNPPIEVPSGYTIQKYSSGANICTASIHGWVE